MIVTRRAGPLAVALVIASTGLARTAHADDEPAATQAAEPPQVEEPEVDATTLQMRAHHRRGVELYDEGDFRLALVELERAYAIGKSYKILFNIGQVHYELRSYAKARLAFEQYLALGGARIDPARRAEVERDLANLRARTATLTIATNVPDAEVVIGGDNVGRAPLEAVIVDAGRVRLEARKRGHETVVREVSLAGGDIQTVTLDLPAIKREIVVTHTSTGLPASVVVAWIATGVLAAGTIGTAIAANAEHSDYERQRGTPISSTPSSARDALERQRDLVTGLAVTTDVLALATLVAGGVSLYLTLREPKRDAPKVAAALGGARILIGF